jgi:uncharacterized membrane protein
MAEPDASPETEAGQASSGAGIAGDPTVGGSGYGDPKRFRSFGVGPGWFLEIGPVLLMALTMLVLFLAGLELGRS